MFPGYLSILLVAVLGLALQLSPQTTRIVQQWALPVIVVCLLLIPCVLAWEKAQDRRWRALPAWRRDRAPYPGLDAFTEDDDGVFFGRDDEIRELRERLHGGSGARERPGHRSIAVIGPSGVGKSSLVYAGLLPRLRQQRRWLVVPPVIPEGDPVQSLAVALADASDDPGDDVGELAARLRSDPAEAGRRLAALHRGHRTRSVLIVIDQAEELLSADDPSAFLALLRDALDADPRLHVLFVLRSEFLTTFLSGSCADLFRHPFTVTPLDRAALRTVIREPARRAGLTFDPPDLVDRIAEDTGDGTALPLLAYLMHELYLGAGRDLTITAAGYQRNGGVYGALTHRADLVLAELEALDPAPPVLPTLLKLVRFAENRPTRRRVRRSALNDAERLVIDAFVRERLCTSGQDGDDAVVEVSHEALFSAWAPLRQTIALHAETLRRIADLEQWAREWDRYGRQDAYLLRAERLTAAQEWLAEAGGPGAVEPLVAQFVECSRVSDGDAMERLSDTIARQVLNGYESDPENALLLALAAYEDCAPTVLARRALSSALAVSRVRGVLHGHEGTVWSVDWSPDGSRLVSSGAEGTVRIWDVRTRTQLAALDGHEGPVCAVAWSPDGRLLASASDDGTIRVWDAADHVRVAVLRGHTSMVWGVAWSPDGSRLASASRDREIRIWDPSAGTSLMVLRGHGGWVRTVSWSPDGTRLASASDDRTVRIWDARTGGELAALRGHEETVTRAAWSPDGTRLASSSYDRTVRLWDPESGATTRTLRGHADLVWELAWSPDGERLATTSFDRTLRLWSAEDGAELVVLRGHAEVLRAVAWSPDGTWLASCSGDRTIRLWDAERAAEVTVFRGHERAAVAVDWSSTGRIVSACKDHTARVWADDGTSKVLRGHTDEIWSVAWSPDGERVATASHDGTARIWTADGAEVSVVRLHDDWVRDVAWSHAGSRLATASDDRTVRLWEPAQDAAPLVLDGHKDTVRGVSWSPDDERLASGSHDGTVRIWEARTGRHLMTLNMQGSPVRALSWSPDGRLIAAVSDNTQVVIWDAAQGTRTGVLSGHDGWIWSMAWSPDSRVLATASADGTARLWDPEAAHELAVAAMHDDDVWDVSWSPDGRHLATASSDRTVRVWEAITDGETLAARARARVFRLLTESERRSLMLPDPR
ncbi:hypothetical protein Acsp03_14450 [Actinomadura sp. NBRC 104412]|nr:hypothetical protein Acsp03_14450 [Actinomadura sp. NBRC 104412]